LMYVLPKGEIESDKRSTQRRRISDMLRRSRRPVSAEIDVQRPFGIHIGTNKLKARFRIRIVVDELSPICRAIVEGLA